jgi:hypothetical protein
MKNNVRKEANKTANSTRSEQAANQPQLPPAPFSNYAGDIPLTIDAICDSLLALTGGWPKCVAGTISYLDHSQLKVLEDSASLFAWIGSCAQVEWKRGSRAVSKDELFKRLHQREHWAWADPYPHFPPVSGVLYLTEPPDANHTGKLDELIDKFRPKTPYDRQLIKALVLTMFWGGPPGKRPQFVIAADEGDDPDAGRGIGKSVLPEYLTELMGGCIDVDPVGDRNRLTSDLLSPNAWNRRVILIDNLKSSKFSNDLLEKLVTRAEITGHRLFKGFGSRPNLLCWVVTVWCLFQHRRSEAEYCDSPRTSQ